MINEENKIFNYLFKFYNNKKWYYENIDLKLSESDKKIIKYKCVLENKKRNNINFNINFLSECGDFTFHDTILIIDKLIEFKSFYNHIGEGNKITIIDKINQFENIFLGGNIDVNYSYIYVVPIKLVCYFLDYSKIDYENIENPINIINVDTKEIINEKKI